MANNPVLCPFCVQALYEHAFKVGSHYRLLSPQAAVALTD